MKSAATAMLRNLSRDIKIKKDFKVGEIRTSVVTENGFRWRKCVRDRVTRLGDF